MQTLISKAREEYHKALISNGVLSIDKGGIPSNADRSNKLSIELAKGIAEKLSAETQEKLEGQSSGSMFEEINMYFLENTFPKLEILRPGKWHIKKLGNRNSITTSSFVQYEHLEYLKNLTEENDKLKASLGNTYEVAPDIVVYRETEKDEVINGNLLIVDDTCAKQADIRKKNNKLPILHASVSAKWTIRSDRAQNSRTEALGLIRNRKGNLPHIVVVTGEPVPSRIASLALGTGDIDCVYHFALYELLETVNNSVYEDAKEMLKILIDGKRLKDISDLPLDLAV